MLTSRNVLDHVPAPHGISLPAEHQLPAGHGWQFSALTRPSPTPTVPASHGVGVELPSPHHDDSMHVSHAVWPGSFW
tara:strand:+ start:531 stop:761 length:231 start_codon:yes stop_codon:yes gene_type:complete